MDLESGYNSTNPSANNPHPKSPHLSVIIFGCLMLIAGIVFVILSFVDRVQFPKFQVDSLNVSNFSLNETSSQVAGNWNLQFSVRNPNKNTGIHYDKLEASIYYKSSVLSKTMMVPFNQGAKNKTVTMTWSFGSEGNYVDGRVMEGINGDRKSGIVVFDVRISARCFFSGDLLKIGSQVSGHSKYRVRM